jgi:arylsulfatase A-like enzyme
MLEAMDKEIARLLVEVGLATRDGDDLVYRPDATNTMVVIVGDNGSYLQTVRLPFDPTRGKGTVYQTGVWVPLIVSGPLVNPANVGKEVPHMVNAAVDVFSLFGEVAGVDVRRAVPRSHTLDAKPMMPYLTNPGQKGSAEDQFHADRNRPPGPRRRAALRHPGRRGANLHADLHLRGAV